MYMYSTRHFIRLLKIDETDEKSEQMHNNSVKPKIGIISLYPLNASYILLQSGPGSKHN